MATGASQRTAAAADDCLRAAPTEILRNISCFELHTGLSQSASGLGLHRARLAATVNSTMPLVAPTVSTCNRACEPHLRPLCEPQWRTLRSMLLRTCVRAGNAAHNTSRTQ